MAWAGAFIVGIFIGLLGSGGSILNIPILIYLVGENEKAAIAESLAIVGIVALVASIPYAQRKLVSWRAVWLFGAPGMLGAYLGALFGEFVPAAAQLTLLALLMLVAAYMMFFPPAIAEPAAPRANWKIVSDGLLVGLFTGLVGVGGGFLIVPALVLLGGLGMREAVGTSLVVITLKSAVGYAKHHLVLENLNISVDWGLITIFVTLGIVGSFAGSALAHRIRQRSLQKVFGTMLVLIGLFLTAKNLPALLF
jgi:hypothetical protein